MLAAVLPVRKCSRSEWLSFIFFSLSIDHLSWSRQDVFFQIAIGQHVAFANIFLFVIFFCKLLYYLIIVAKTNLISLLIFYPLRKIVYYS